MTAPSLDRTPLVVPEPQVVRRVDVPASPLINPRIVVATARRVLAQLRADRRTMAMLLVVPSALLCLTQQMFDSQPVFNRTALALLGIFPFMLMFLVTSVAMLRERTGGTLERLMTMPMSKLDLLLGYGLAFAVAATAQATVTCAVSYWLLGLYTPGNPLLVLAIAVAGAVLGMAIGLLTSAFATSEFQAVQFMPVVVLPQVLLGGLFVPREQMTDWLEGVSHALPLSYSIEAMQEVGSRSMLTAKLAGDLAVVVVSALVALGLAAATLRRRSGGTSEATRRTAFAVAVAVLVSSLAVAGYQLVDMARYVTTDDALVDGDQIPIVASTSGTLVDWRADVGTQLRRSQSVGRIEMRDGVGRAQRVLRAPATGVVAHSEVVRGVYVTRGTRLAVAYDPASVYISAHVDETDIDHVRLGQAVDVILDGGPDGDTIGTVTGVVTEIRAATSDQTSQTPRQKDSVVFDRRTQVIPVKIAVLNGEGLPLVPGMNATVKIHRD